MQFPENLMYAKSHEWVQYLSNGHARVGISAYAQEQLGDVVFITLPEVGDEVEAGGRLADVESVKAVSDIYAPVSGKVVAVNEALLDDPAQLNSAPYDAWIAELDNVVENTALLDAKDYAAEVEA